MSLKSLLNQWDKAHFTDDTLVYNLRDFSNDIKDIMPALDQDSFYLDETILDDTSDWNNLSPNTFAYAKTFGGKNTPKISGSGFVMNLVSDTYSLQIAYSGKKIAVRFNQGDWTTVSDGNNTDVINLLKDYAKKSDIPDMTQYVKRDPDTGVASQDINFTGNIKKNGVTIADTDDLKTLVTDNHDGTEQLNGVRVQPFNKLSDTIGGRNLLPGTSGTLQIVTNASGWNTNLPVITPVVTKIDSDTTYTARVWLSPASHDMSFQVVWQDSSGVVFYGGGNVVSAGASGYSTWTGTIKAGSTIQRVSIVFGAQQSTPSSVSYKEMKFEQGSVATDWTPAPEDKVNVSDMRKPASDVAGIEEVNAKQDKIIYTPADDSKVVHDNHDNTITANNVKYDLSKTGLTQITIISSGSFNDLPLGTIFVDATKVTDGPDSIHWFTTTTSDFNLMGDRKAQIAIADDKNLMYLRVSRDMVWNSWVLLSDDSKVAHLSGANNFDTVPTVNNNPVLLASSLPSDLARTGKDANFTGKLQKSGIDVATTTDVTKAVNTATSNSSKYIKASKNNENSAISDSTKGNSNDIYYWCEN